MTGNGVLTHAALLERMNAKDLRKRLILTPLLDQQCIGESALDVRLGNQFLVLRRESVPTIDIAASDFGTSEKYLQRIVRNFREPLVLHPRELLIGSTLEYMQVPQDLMCYVVGKSTWGRLGLIIATATKVDPGFKGCITLEIVNEGEVPLLLYPGVPIAQLVVHETTGVSTYKGGYSLPIGPQFPKIRVDDSLRFWFPRDRRRPLPSN